MLKAAPNNHINFYRVEDFNIDTLKQAFLEGRLYIQSATSETSREDGIQAILQYVARIDTCATHGYLSTIRQLWEKILRSPELGELFFLNRYSSNRGKPNWYRVNVVVAFLLEKNVYKRDYTAVQLHLLMEQSDKRNKHYTCMTRYLLERSQIKILMQYIEHLRIPD